MTLPGPGNPLTMAQINAEFGYGFNLNAYRGKVWYYDNGQVGIFPLAPNPIAFADFYSKRTGNPVTPSEQTFASSGTFTTPAVYTIMTITVRGGGGGAAGAFGTINCGAITGTTYGSPGYSGGSSSFGVYAAASGGSGGLSNGSSGVDGDPYNDGVPAGGSGFGGGGSGGSGGYSTVTLISPTVGGAGPSPGSLVSVVVGAGGVGGKGGPNSEIWSGACTIIGYSTNGQDGNDGSVYIQWS